VLYYENKGGDAIETSITLETIIFTLNSWRILGSAGMIGGFSALRNSQLFFRFLLSA